MEILNIIEQIVWGMPCILLLSALHVYFTIKLKCPQKDVFKGLQNLIKMSKGGDKKGISPFASLMSVLASTLGAGNIIGVAAAIAVGGPRQYILDAIYWSICDSY